MRAVTWQGAKDIRVENVPDPTIEEPHRHRHPGHVDRAVRLRPAPLRGAGAVHGARRHRRPRADGRRRGGRRGRAPPRRRRPGRDPVQRQLRPLLDVRARAAEPVRDDAEHRARHRREPARLQQALRPGARRPGGVPPRPARRLRRGQGAQRAARRPLPVPQRRAAHRLAGRGVRRRPRRRDAAGARCRARSATWRRGSPCTGATATIVADLVPERLQRVAAAARRPSTSRLDGASRGRRRSATRPGAAAPTR